MKTIRIRGVVDEDHQLRATLPPSLPPGPVDVLVVVPADTELHHSIDWMSQVAREWKAELNLTDEDLYNFSDGEPVDGTR
jgi:hypothetical protein